MPEESKDKRSKLKAILASPYTMPAATILPAVIAFIFSRRVRPRATPHAEARAEGIRRTGIGVTPDLMAKDKMNQLRAALQYGTPHVGPPQALPEHLHAVVYPFPQEIQAAGRPNIGNLPRFGNAKDKLAEIKYLRAEIGPHAAPYSTSVAEHIGKWMENITAPEARLLLLSKSFADKHPAGYVLKPVVTRGRTVPLQHTDNLIEEYYKLFKFDLNEPRPEWHRLAVVRAIATNTPVKPMTLLDAITKLQVSPHPEFLAELLDKAPADMKKPLMAYTTVHAPSMMFVQDHVRPVAEYRMHVLDGRIVPGTTVPRHNKLEALRSLIGFPTRLSKQMEAKVQNNLLNKLKPEDMRDRMLALDVAVKPDGEPVILETNYNAWSGFLSNRGLAAIPAAINMHRWMGELAGQRTLPHAAGHSLMAGALGAGAVYGARRLSDTQPDDSAQT